MVQYIKIKKGIIMKGRNCPNCGAPFDTEKSKCAYCGTSYFDMAAIDIDEHEPFYLKFKIKGQVITALVIAEPNVSIDMNCDDVYARYGNHYLLFPGDLSATVDLRFRSVCTPDKKMFVVEKAAEPKIVGDPLNAYVDPLNEPNTY